MDYGTALTEDADAARIITKPRKMDRTFSYPFHLREGVWVLARERGWYTRHTLDYAERELEDDVLCRHVPPSQTTIADF